MTENFFGGTCERENPRSEGRIEKQKKTKIKVNKV